MTNPTPSIGGDCCRFCGIEQGDDEMIGMHESGCEIAVKHELVRRIASVCAQIDASYGNPTGTAVRALLVHHWPVSAAISFDMLRAAYDDAVDLLLPAPRPVAAA